MVEELEITEQVEQQQDPPTKKRALYDAVSKKYNLGSYEEFETKLKDPTKRKALYDHVGKEFELGTFQEFETKLQEPTPSKKKVGTVSFGETYSSPELDSETPSTGEIPTVVDYGDGEPLPNNIVDLSRKATEYSKKTKEIERTDMRGNPIPETVPDESFIGTSKKIIEDLDKQGIKKDFVDVVSDLPDEAFNDPNTSKDKLVELYKTNRIKFHQFVNEQKNRIAIKKAAFENQRNANNGIDDIDPTQMAVHVANKYLGTYEEAHPQNLDQLQDIILKKQDIIGQYLIGEERTKALERVRESYSSYINPTNPDIQAEYEQSPLKGKVDVTQYSALKTLQLFDAKKYEQAVNILNTDIQKQYTFKPEFENFQSPVAASTSVTTSDSTLAAKNKGSLSSETIDQQIGKESILRQLTELGRNNLVTQINSQQYDLEQSFNNTDNPEEKEAIKQQYVLNQGKLDEVSKNASQDNIKFPLTSKLEFDNQVKELVQDAGMGAVEYGTNKFAHGVGVGGESFEDMAVSIFGSEKDKALLGMKRMGESKWFESKTYLPEDYRSTNSPFIMQPSEALKDAAKGITGGKKLSDLSADQKQQLTELVANNQSQIETVTNPKAGKSKNFFSKATLYSNTGFIGEVGAFMYKIMGAKSLGLSGKSAELLTLYNDGYSAAYNQKILEGNEEEANQYGILHGGVMLLAGTVSSKFDAVKSMLAASKSPISKQILGLGEAGWDAIVNKNKSTISKIANGVSDVVKSNAKMIGTYGVGVSIASDLADKGFFNKDISVSEIADNAKHSAIDMAIGSVGLAGIGFISHAIKNPVTLKDKATIWEIGDNKEFSKQRIDEAVAKNELTQSEGDAKKKTIDNVASLIEKVPTENSKGKPLTDNQKVKLLYNLILKEKGKEAAKDLPDNQSDKAEHIAMVADYANGIILENPTEKQLESRKNTLEKQVEGKDENGKPLLPEKELIKAKAQLEAVNDAIQRKENNVEVQAPISTGESIPLKTEEQSRNENGIVVEKPMVVPEPITVSSEPTKPQPTNEAKANELQQPTKVESTTIKEPNKVGEGAEETQKTYTKNALDRADAKKIYAQVREVDVPQDAAQIALEYIANGGKVSEEAINQVAGSVKRASLNTGRKEKRSAEYNLRDYASKTNETLDALAHRLWEANDQRISEMDIKDALMDAIGSHSTRLDAGKTYLERYSAEYQENKLQEKFYQEHLEEIAAEEKAIAEMLSKENTLAEEAMADENYVIKLIEKYETENKGQDKQPATKTESGTDKGTGSNAGNEKTEAGEPPIVPPGTPKGGSEGAFVEPPEISFRKDSFVRARNKVGIDEFVDEGKTTHIAESTKAQRTVEKWKEDGSYAENIADIQDRASRGEISNQEKFIFAKHLADLDATVNAIKDVNSKEYDIALGEYNKALNAADAARSAAGRQLGMIPKNRGTAQTLADVMSDMMNDNKADVLTTEQKKTAEKRYEKVKEALDKEAALRIEIEAEAEKLRAENALLKKQVEGKGKPKEGKVYKDGKRDFDAETKNYKDELKKLAEEYKAAGQKLGISSDGGGESFVISAKMAKVVMKIVGVKVEQMGVKLKEVTEATLKEVKDIFDGITEKDIREIIAGKYNEKKATKNDLLSQMYDLKQEQKLLFELEALENGETPKTEKALKAKNQRLKEIRDKIDALKKQNGIGKYSDESKVAAAEKAAQKNIGELEEKIANNDLEFDKIEKPTSPQLEAYREKQKALRKELEEKRKEAKVGKYSDESKVAAAEKAAQKNIGELEEKIANNDLEFDKIDKPTSPQLEAYREKQKALRKELEEKRKEAKVGKYSDESKFISAAKTRIEANKKKQKEISDRIKNKDFSEEPESKSILDNTELQKKNKKLYEEYQKSVIDKEKTLFQYEQERIDDKIRNYNLAEKVGHYAELAFHTSKGSVAIFDQSGLLVQLIQTTGSHPWWTAKSILPALRDLVTPKWFDANMAKLKQSKYWDLFQKMDLPLYDTHSHDINFRNDLLGGDKNLMNKDIIIGGKKMSIGKAFERSTATLFNNIRVKLATEKIEELHREGKTWENSPEEFKQAARVIAEFTGHGKVHKAFTNENWNILIWSSKMLASTFNVLGLGDVVRPVSTAKAIGKGLEGTKVGNLLGIKNVSIDPKKSKGFYSSLTPQQRKFAAKEMSRFIASGATLLAAAYLKGQFLDDEEEKTTVDVNPLSTDFGTIKSGDKTVNVYGRYGSAVGAIAQIMMGVRYLGGREDVLGDKYGDKSEADVAFGKFGRGKMTPVLGLVYDYKFNDKKNYFTKEKITGMGALKQAISPLAFQDIAKDIKREDPALSIALWTLFKVYGGNVRDRRDFIEQDLKVPEWKFLNDKGLKLTKKSKESLKPVDADGKPIEVTEDKYKDFLKKREEYVRQDIEKLMKGEGYIEVEKGVWENLPKSKLKDLTYDEIKGWIMTKTNQANDKAMMDVFEGEQATQDSGKRKIETQ